MLCRLKLRSNLTKLAVISSLIFSGLFLFSNIGVVNEGNMVYVNEDHFYSIPHLGDFNIATQAEPIEINLTRYSSTSHPLENSCKYPILNPNDETLKDVVTHPRRVQCNEVQENYLQFDEQTNTLNVNQTLAQQVLGVKIMCHYRPFAGTLKPDVVDLKPLNDWKQINRDQEKITADQFEVKCHAENDTKKTETVYRFAYAQIAPRPGVKYSDNTETRLSVDMIVLDSTSLNMFRRHMPRSYDYMKNEMGFFHLEGYNKVADNSMVNLLPILTGLRYLNMSYKNHSLPSDLPETGILDFDSLPFLWKDFSAKGCPTMFNDDVMDFTRGIFHYPWDIAKGFKNKPTDYFFRPWHVWHRRYPLANASQFCFGDVPYHQLQLNLINQMIRTYNKTCHFSFSFITDLPHDDPSNLERMDDDLRQILEGLYQNNHLNNTVLIITGDHGHRIHQIMYKYIGRIEERMSLFSIYFPKWFRDKHPEIMENLQYNKNRLSSNYDINRMLKDIVNEYFQKVPRESIKGTSLFSKLPAKRTCMDANIPDNHCTCMELVRQLKPNDELSKQSYEIILNYTKYSFRDKKNCPQTYDITVNELSVYTSSQMIQHGVRNPNEEFLKRLEKHVVGDVEYIEVRYIITPFNVEAKIRLQHNINLKHIFINSQPIIINYDLIMSLCGKDVNPKEFCTCFNV